MYNKQKAAFIKCGNFSHTNESVLNLLSENFPNMQFDVIDIFSDLISKRDVLTLLHSLKLYGKEILLGQKTITETYLRTPYVINRIKRSILNRLADQDYAFTFQTQSLFDSSVPGIPHFLYTDHTHLANLSYPDFKYQNLMSKKWIECEKKIYQNATLNFTMSSNITKSMIVDYSCNPERVICVFCGANVSVTEHEEQDTSRYSRKNILFIGVDWERKGGPTLVKAFNKVLSIYPDATLTIVGCSPEINLPNCQVIGNVPLVEVKKYFNQASVFCLPTRIEPFGIVLLEAMAHKLPVVATNIGAIPDFIIEEKNGNLIRPNDEEQLAKKIIRLLGSPEKCQDYGEFGHKLYWEKYTWEKTGVRICENIKQFLK